MPKHITVYTTTTCAYCGMVKKWLDMKGMKYEVVNLDDYPERRVEVEAITAEKTVPITVVTKADDTKEVVTGWNLALLAPLVS